MSSRGVINLLILLSILLIESTYSSLYYVDVITDVELAAQNELTDIYYPSLSSSQDSDSVSLDSFDEDNGIPIVVTLPGGNVDKSEYSIFASLIASHGFIVTVGQLPVSTPFSEVPVIIPRQDTVSHTIDKLIDLHTNDVTSVLYNNNLGYSIDFNNIGLTGHSIGGNMGLFVIDGDCIFPPIFCDLFIPYNNPIGIKTGIFYGASFFSPGIPLPDYSDNKVSLSLIAGSEDFRSPVSNAQDSLDLINNNNWNTFDFSLFTLEGANHFGIDNTQPAINFGDQTLDQYESISRIAKIVTKWMRVYLKENDDIFEEIYGSDSDDTDNNSDENEFVEGVTIQSQKCEQDCQ